MTRNTRLRQNATDISTKLILLKLRKHKQYTKIKKIKNENKTPRNEKRRRFVGFGMNSRVGQGTI